MFFADPIAAVREALRVLLEDGSVAFAVWSSSEANPFFSTVTDVIDRFLEGYPQNSDAPDTFRFAVPGELAGILEPADAKNEIVRQLKFRIDPAISFDQLCQLRTQLCDSLRVSRPRL